MRRAPWQTGMKVVDVERIVCEVPFTERQARITEREVYTWNVIELCKVTLDSGLVGCAPHLYTPHCTHEPDAAGTWWCNACKMLHGRI